MWYSISNEYGVRKTMIFRRDLENKSKPNKKKKNVWQQS